MSSTHILRCFIGDTADILLLEHLAETIGEITRIVGPIGTSKQTDVFVYSELKADPNVEVALEKAIQELYDNPYSNTGRHVILFSETGGRSQVRKFENVPFPE